MRISDYYPGQRPGFLEDAQQPLQSRLHPEPVVETWAPSPTPWVMVSLPQTDSDVPDAVVTFHNLEEAQAWLYSHSAWEEMVRTWNKDCATTHERKEIPPHVVQQILELWAHVQDPYELDERQIWNPDHWSVFWGNTAQTAKRSLCQPLIDIFQGKISRRYSIPCFMEKTCSLACPVFQFLPNPTEPSFAELSPDAPSGPQFNPNNPRNRHGHPLPAGVIDYHEEDVEMTPKEDLQSRENHPSRICAY